MLTTLQALFVFTGILLSIISVPLILRKIKPNPFYGFRTPFTFSNEHYWYEINAYCGKWLFVSGIVIAVFVLILAAIPNMSLDLYAIAITLVIGIMLLVSFTMSVVYMRKLRKES